MDKKTIIAIICLGLLPSGVPAARENLFRSGTVSVSSAENLAPFINDGRHDRESTWISGMESGKPHIVEISLDFYCTVDSVAIHTGIPAAQMTREELHQAAGYWCMKNFILQYWDDANWTDISETYTTENRLDRISFSFRTPVKSCRFRIVSTDGEPIRVSEFEGYGKSDMSMPAPERLASGVRPPETGSTTVFADILPERAGQTMHYVGYNQGYFVPGSNVAAWWEYSGVNSARIWADLNTYVKSSWFDDASGVTSLERFESRKSRLRNAPLEHLKLDKIAGRADEVVNSTNTMSLNYALEVLNRLDVDILVQSGFSDYSLTWQNKWNLWERFYNLAFYLAREGDVEMYAMKNDPNHRHAGPMPLDSWIELMRVVSDAVHCAVEDVDRIYGKDLEARFVGPVTAGTNTNWWAAAAASDRVDYRGDSTSRNLIDIFSTHSYNLPASGYRGRVTMIDSIMRANDPAGRTKPVVFTEIGRWMNAYLIDKEETMDSPSLFTEWAGIYAQNMREGCYGMWAFKFGNTASSTYPRGIKSGHHYMWKGNRFTEDSFRNLAIGADVDVSAVPELAGKINDGDKSDDSAWICGTEGQKSIVLNLGKETALYGIGIYSGSAGGEFTAPDRVRSLRVEYLSGQDWRPAEGASDTKSKYAQVYYTFKEPVSTSSVRVVIGDPGEVKIREILLFGENTLSGTEKSYDVSGAQRTAEVVRLFAKGFKDSRPLFECRLSAESPDFDFLASADTLTGNIYVWIVNRKKASLDLKVDMRETGVAPGTDVIYEQVDACHYGEADVLRISSDGLLHLTAGAQSVGLLTVHSSMADPVRLPAAKAVCVRGGAFSGKVQKGGSLRVGMDYSDRSSDHVTYVSFDMKDVYDAGRIVFGVHGRADGDRPYRYHVYCFEGGTASGLKWDGAPYLDADESRALSVGTDCFIAGEIAMDSYPDYHYLDVTDVVRNHAGSGKVTFMLVRELREPGDTYDDGRNAEISPVKSSEPPILLIWQKNS